MRLKIVTLVTLSAFAFSALSVTSAQAEGPFFKRCGKKESPTCAEPLRLKKTETLTPTSEAAKVFVLESKKLGVTLECSELKLEKATLIGSEVGTGGSSTQTDVFSGCMDKGNGEKCAVENGTMSTAPLTVKLARENSTPTMGEKFFLNLAPKEGNTFMTVKFKAEPGGKCTLTSAGVELATGATVGVIGTAEGGMQETLKYKEVETFGESNFLAFPKALTASDFVEEGGVATKVTSGLTFSSNPVSRFEGLAKATVAGTDWGVFGV